MKLKQFESSFYGLFDFIQSNKKLPKAIAECDPEKLQILLNAINRADFNHAIFEDTDCDLYLLRLYKNNAITESVFTTCYTYLLALMEFGSQPMKAGDVGKHPLINKPVMLPSLSGDTVDPIFDEHIDSLVQYFKHKLFTNHSHITREFILEFCKTLSKPESAMLRIRFEQNDEETFANVAEFIKYEIHCPLNSSINSVNEENKHYTDIYLLPFAVTDYLKSLINGQPVKLTPRFGIVSDKTLRAMHLDNSHIYQLYNKHVKNNITVVHQGATGPFVIAMHDLFHTTIASFVSESSRHFLCGDLIATMSNQAFLSSHDVALSSEQIRPLLYGDESFNDLLFIYPYEIEKKLIVDYLNKMFTTYLTNEKSEANKASFVKLIFALTPLHPHQFIPMLEQIYLDRENPLFMVRYPEYLQVKWNLLDNKPFNIDASTLFNFLNIETLRLEPDILNVLEQLFFDETRIREVWNQLDRSLQSILFNISGKLFHNFITVLELLIKHQCFSQETVEALLAHPDFESFLDEDKAEGQTFMSFIRTIINGYSCNILTHKIFIAFITNSHHETYGLLMNALEKISRIFETVDMHHLEDNFLRILTTDNLEFMINIFDKISRLIGCTEDSNLLHNIIIKIESSPVFAKKLASLLDDLNYPDCQSEKRKLISLLFNIDKFGTLLACIPFLKMAIQFNFINFVSYIELMVAYPPYIPLMSYIISQYLPRATSKDILKMLKIMVEDQFTVNTPLNLISDVELSLLKSQEIIMKFYGKDPDFNDNSIKHLFENLASHWKVLGNFYHSHEKYGTAQACLQRSQDITIRLSLAESAKEAISEIYNPAFFAKEPGVTNIDKPSDFADKDAADSQMEKAPYSFDFMKCTIF